VQVVAASGPTSDAVGMVSSLSEVSAGPDGHVGFLTTTSGIFRRNENFIEHVLAAGQSIPGGTISGVGAPALDEDECVLAVVLLAGGDERLYRRCGDLVEAILAVGDLVDGTAIASFDLGRPVAAGGYVAVLVTLTGGTGTIVRVSEGLVTRIVGAGDPSPGGGVFSSVHLAGITGSGVVGFRGFVSGGRDGVFRGDGQAITKLLTAGDGSAAGRVASVDGAAQNAVDGWALLLRLDDGRRGMFRMDAAAVLPIAQAVAMQDEEVPGRPGVTLRSFPTSLVPSVSVAGHIAFRATLGGVLGGSAVFQVPPAGAPQILFTTREPTAVGLITRLRDPRVASDGSVAVSALPPGSGTSVFEHANGQVSVLAGFGEGTDLVPLERRYRFLSPAVRGSADTAVFLGHYDEIRRWTGEGRSVRVTSTGAASPLGGEFAEFGPASFDEAGTTLFRAEVSGGSSGQGIFAVPDGTAPGGSLVGLVSVGARAPKGGRMRELPATGVAAGGDISVARRWGGFPAGLEATAADSGLFRVRGRKTRALERAGRKAPGGGRYVSFGMPALATPKRYAFVAEVLDGTQEAVVVARRGRRRIVVAREGLDTGTRIARRYEAFENPDATGDAIVFRATLNPGTDEGVFLSDWRRTGLLVATGDAAAGDVLRGFGRPVLTTAGVVFRAGVAGGRTVLLRSAVTEPPALDAPAAALETLLATGDPSPLGGRIASLGTVRAAFAGSVVVDVQLEGASARFAVLRVYDEVP
jgi:hypothetical protein